tara:strand:+ start:5490 stop:5972 length:483 start_codon:yes stop_codon:yes gene_type:complete
MYSLFSTAEPVSKLLKDRGQTIAVSESAAGGLIAAALLSVEGASSYFLGGATVYTQIARRELLQLSKSQVKMRGASESYALITAEAIRDKMGADWGIGESGAAGPLGNRYGDAAGHVALGVVGPVKMSRTLETGNTNREQNMWSFCNAAMDLLYEAIGRS